MSSTNCTYILKKGKNKGQVCGTKCVNNNLLCKKHSIDDINNNQDTLQNAADALSDYLIIGLLWTIGTCLIFYANYKWNGVIINTSINLAIVYWIYWSYIKSFNSACDKYQLEKPIMFKQYM
jgi:hypothetical protein